MILSIMLLAASLFSSGVSGQVLNDGTVCEANKLVCADGSKCVSMNELCDYNEDCPDSSDEFNLVLCKKMLSMKNECSKGQIKCTESHYFSNFQNQCMDIGTACTLGKKCIRDLSICEEIGEKKLALPPQSNETEFMEVMRFLAESFNETIRANFSICPPLYKSFNGKCISIFTPIQISWDEAKLFCESTSGVLGDLSNVDEFNEVLDYLRENNVKSNFWIGGHFDRSMNYSKWVWIDGKNIKMGAPFWGLRVTTFSGYRHSDSECEVSKKIMPSFGYSSGRCLAILDENYYYFSNEECSKKCSPLCITNRVDSGVEEELQH